MEGRRARPRSKLRDVAELAGVSTSTVSLVLAGKGEANRISEDTHRRVQEAAATLNYAPSLLHRSVRNGRTGNISFYNSFRNRQAGDLYMDRLSAAIEHAGGRHRFNVLVQCFFDQSVQETYEFLNGGFADGLVVYAPSDQDPLLVRLRESGLPTVILNPRSVETNLSSVEDDHGQSMEAIAEALFDLGHRRVVVFTQDSPGWYRPQDREERLRKGLIDRGADPADIRTVVCAMDFDAAIAQALDTPRKPTAFFAWNDRTGYFLLDAIERAGLRVPEDVSMVGYDGIVWPSASSHVIASIHVSLETLADAAVEILGRLIKGEEGPLHHRIPGDFSPGTTLGPPPPDETAPGRREAP